MKCPVDDSPLSISSREGIEIDFCPQCRGVWLDRGELDKIIERASSSLAPGGGGGDLDRDRDRDRDRYARAPRDDRYEERRYDDRDHDRRHDDDDHEHGGRRRRKKRSFLDDLFEFGGD